jgi:predicted DNA-binding transcriptional regulator YafY
MAETTERVLRLLGLLQQRPVWTGPELAERLGVTTRSIRRDVERLRGLGYPVSAAQGVGGGYQLGRGRGLPPLLLDDTEAVAVAVSLRMAAGGTVSGASEAALRTLAKLDQVMPPRLRSEVRAIHEATQTLDHGRVTVDGDVLLTLARGVRDLVRVRFGYEARDGTASRRTVEPVGLVAAGRRWYLMAHDVDRDDWRTFRLDRMTSVATTTWRFRERPHEDPATYVQRSVAVRRTASRRGSWCTRRCARCRGAPVPGRSCSPRSTTGRRSWRPGRRPSTASPSTCPSWAGSSRCRSPPSCGRRSPRWVGARSGQPGRGRPRRLWGWVA